MKTVHHQSHTDARKRQSELIRRLLLAWLTAATVEFLLLPAELKSLNGLKGLAAMSFPRLLIATAVVLVLLEGFSRLLRRGAERWMLLGMFAVLAAVSVTMSFTWPFLGICLLLFAILFCYARCGWDLTPMPKSSDERSGAAAGLTAVLAIGFFLLVSVWTVCRVYSFSVPTFDFGIFAQMFHSMKTTGLPITTVERDGALSHFAVHVSPIYYLLLPFYMLVPVPATLQVMQAAVLASAVIPLYRIAKRHGLPPFMRAALCALLLLYPAYAGGTGYDIHENAFLTPLILWLFDGIDRKNGWVTTIAAALTLMVKEDAAVYVAVVALWLLMKSFLRKDQRWGLIAGGALFLSAIVYFLGTTAYLSRFGDGVMTYRYKNFMYDGSTSLVTVIKAVLLSPMKAIFECVDKEKLEFIGLTLMPLALIPLLTRRYERFILLIPYILVNLMSDYQYQHDIFFQYTYGSTACLLYLVTVNLADFKGQKKRIAALGLALLISASCFGTNILPVALRYPKYCKTYAGYYDSLRDVLDTIPEDASVAATTFYTTYLSQRDILYDVRYASEEHIFSCAYMALNVTDQNSYKAYAVNGENGYENFVAALLERGYEKIAEYKGKLEIYKK